MFNRSRRTNRFGFEKTKSDYIFNFLFNFTLITGVVTVFTLVIGTFIWTGYDAYSHYKRGCEYRYPLYGAKTIVIDNGDSDKISPWICPYDKKDQ